MEDDLVAGVENYACQIPIGNNPFFISLFQAAPSIVKQRILITYFGYVLMPRSSGDSSF